MCCAKERLVSDTSVSEKLEVTVEPYCPVVLSHRMKGLMLTSEEFKSVLQTDVGLLLTCISAKDVGITSISMEF